MNRILKLCLFVLFVSACAPVTQKIGLNFNIPSLGEDVFITSDGQKMAVTVWRPKGEAKAIIIGLHGFNDYRRAFEIPSEQFTSSGIMVYAYDQRGFGENKNIGIWPTRDLLVKDLNEFSQSVKGKHPNTPIFILGESMGGAVSILFSAQDNPAIKSDGVILAGPAIWGWSTMNLFYKTMLWVSAHLTPWWSPTGESLGKMPSDNIEMLNDLYHDPFIIKKTRIDSVYGLVGLMDDAYKAGRKMKGPTLVLFGQNDDIIPSKAAQKFKQILPEGVKIKEYETGYHMLLRDLEREKAIKDIISFIFKKR